jgi:nicotinamide phosphoribosyltransferase
MKIPFFNLCDGYKLGHIFQYPKNTAVVYSNYTARGSRFKGVDKIIFVYLQYFIKKYLIEEINATFFNVPKEKAIQAYQRRVTGYLGRPIDTSHLEQLHDLGYLPLKIKALPEGALVGTKIPLLTIHNLNDGMFDWVFYWITNYIETVLSATIWQPITSATIAFQYRLLLERFAAETVGKDNSFVKWQGHDFSFRGMSSVESACSSGFGHLTSFTGTDTIPAIDIAELYYNANSDKELIGGSVPATEHAVMCAGGGVDNGKSIEENELNTFNRLITEVYPQGIVSIVSDTWDLWKVVTKYVTILKDVILGRDGKVVIRPDSGDPVKIVTGYKKNEMIERDGKFYESRYYEDQEGGRELSQAEIKGVVECLWDVFGGTTTEKGYKLLDSHIGVIYGDSITLERCEQILTRLAEKGFASYNMVFGIGSFTYQYNTRDTFGQAMKATWAKVDGKEINIFKDPITDNGLKKSACGLLQVKFVNGEYTLKDKVTHDEEQDSELQTVFLNGKLVKDWTLAEVRANVEANLAKELNK